MKKLLTILLGVVFCMALTLGLTACRDKNNSSSSSTPPAPPATDVYQITVLTLDSQPVENVTVSLYKDSSVIASGTTNASGLAAIEATADTYNVAVSNMPLGYSQLTQATVTDTAFTPINIIVSQGIPAGTSAPAGHHYTVGNLLYDFSVTTYTPDTLLTGGSTFTLSEVLESKKMVLINFWATWCGPCKSEFPAMNSAYEKYTEDVALVALSTSDSVSGVKEFIEENQLSFPMAPDVGLFSMFAPIGSTSIPLSVVVDRYGTMAFVHTGSMTEEKDFTSLFDKYISDDYVPEYAPVIGGGNNDDVVLEYARPTEGLVMPASSAIESAINNTESGFKFAYYPETGDDAEFTWPWLISDDGQSIYPSNINNHYSFATIYTDITLKAGEVVAFDYLLNCEKVYDVLYVQIDGLITHELEGNHGDEYQSCYAFVAERDGTYKMNFLYYKDTDTHADNETVRIKNLRICDVEDIDVPTDIQRFAADFPVEGWSKESKTPRYQRYAQVALNPEDKYYHVLAEDGTPTGPLLMADLMYSTHWSQNSVYQYAYNGLCVFDGFDYQELFETYAWMANNSDTKFVPVNAELQFLLDQLTKNRGIGYENEWLETCVYFDHYGGGEPIKNPTYGIHFKTAIPLEIASGETSVTFTAEIRKVLVPRGYRYSFVPSVSGIYQLSSLVPKEKANSCDPIAWLFDEEYNELALHDTVIAQKYPNSDTFDLNFKLIHYLEAGKTYYFAIGDYDIYYNGDIDVELKFLGETYHYFTTCAETPHTFDEATGKIYLPGAIRTTVDNDGYIRELKADGSLGSYIYLNMFTETSFIGNGSLETILYNSTEAGYSGMSFDFSKDKKPNGTYYKNYTETMFEYLGKAEEGVGELYGFVKVDETLLEILQIFTAKYSFPEATDTWQAMCYYYEELGA